MGVGDRATSWTWGRAESRIVIIVASAGGMQALTTLIAQLPGDFPAAVCIVYHMSPEITGLPLVRELDRSGALPCRLAEQGEAIAPGMVYFAPVDQHMLIDDGRILITKGARENRSRPAIDPLFRSAAAAFGHRVIGIVLTGSLSDGTSGMMAIKRCGGICIAQDPADASYPDMPQSVISNVGVDHVASIAEMGALLVGVVGRPPPPSRPIPEDIVIEAGIAARVLSDVPAVSALGSQVPFNCPDCGGVLSCRFRNTHGAKAARRGLTGSHRSDPVHVVVHRQGRPASG